MLCLWQRFKWILLIEWQMVNVSQNATQHWVCDMTSLWFSYVETSHVLPQGQYCFSMQQSVSTLPILGSTTPLASASSSSMAAVVATRTTLPPWRLVRWEIFGMFFWSHFFHFFSVLLGKMHCRWTGGCRRSQVSTWRPELQQGGHRQVGQPRCVLDLCQFGYVKVAEDS